MRQQGINTQPKESCKAVYIVSSFIRDCKKANRVLKEIHLRADLWQQFRDFVMRDMEKKGVGEDITNQVYFCDILIKNSALMAGEPFFPYFNELKYEA